MMQSEYLKILWGLRFEKIKKTEGKAAWGYQDILEECLEFVNKDHEIIQLLHQLVSEERAHEKLADELLALWHQAGEAI
ncbi:MAG: hypothetical protein H6757_02545 [Candidatus Omnitrophica bacterium]|nr:hypothetical protein [Candidatus Omnitrophota bacterium]